MPVFTTPSSLHARRSARNASLPLNVNTASTEPTTDVDQVNPSSPTPVNPVSPLPENENVVLKTRRAYDRDRQRVKKRKERAERERERNALLTPVQAVHSRDAAGRHSGGGRTGGGAKPQLVLSEDSDVTWPLPSSPVDDIITDVMERTMLARADALTTLTNTPIEVHLGQLIKPAKARKSKAGDFEVVSELPAVIALDDQISDDGELDEPWEHISADELDEKKPSPLSYATVLANAI